MKRKPLFYALLVCMLLSAFVLIVVIGKIYFLRDHLAKDSPGEFNHFLQTDYNISRFEHALYAYERSRNIDESELKAIKSYQHNYDLVWSGISIFNLRKIESDAQKQAVMAFITNAERYLRSNEALITSGVPLTTAQVESLLRGAARLTAQLRLLGQSYFAQSTAFHDLWNYELQKLHLLFWIFTTLLIVMAIFLIGFLIRSNSRANLMVEELEIAREQLNKNISALRSGRLENKAKDRFIAAASHDLRQPLHSLGLFLGELDRYIAEPAGKVALVQAAESASSLNKLFNSLLDLSKIESGFVDVSMQTFEIGSLLRLMRHEFAASAIDAGIELVVSNSSQQVYSDPIILNRIVRNLIDNAINHSSASRINVVVELVTSGLALCVCDNGRGIPKEEQSRIFSEYYQLNSPNRDHSKGLGLGLAIVKRLSDLLEIEIKLKSSEKHVTEFQLILPLGTEISVNPTHAIVAEEFPEPAVSNSLVAVIDDDKRICTAMDTMLKSMSLRSVSAESTNELINKLVAMNELPCLLIADYRLAEGQVGDRAIQKVREALSHDIPGILVTGDTSPTRAVNASKAGLALLQKPVEPKLLKNAIYKALNQDIALVE